MLSASASVLRKTHPGSILMAKPKVTLFVDIVSPFAYLGFYALQVGRQSFSTDQHDSFAAVVTYVLHAQRLVFNAFWWLMRTVDIVFLATVVISRPESLVHATQCCPLFRYVYRVLS